MSKRLEATQDELLKFKEFYSVLVDIIKVKQDGKEFSDFFRQLNYKSIAIYGMRELGTILFKELKDSDTTVNYFIDRQYSVCEMGVPVYSPCDDLPDVDVVVITAIHYFDDIAYSLQTKVKCPILGLDDIVYEMTEW